MNRKERTDDKQSQKYKLVKNPKDRWRLNCKNQLTSRRGFFPVEFRVQLSVKTNRKYVIIEAANTNFISQQSKHKINYE